MISKESNLATETAVEVQTVEQEEALCQLAEEDNDHCIRLANLSVIKIRDIAECMTCSGETFFSENPVDIDKSKYTHLFLKAAGLKVEKLEGEIAEVTFSKRIQATPEKESRFKKEWRLDLYGREIGYIRSWERDLKEISMIVFDTCML